jgi:hypothetical protein
MGNVTPLWNYFWEPFQKFNEGPLWTRFGSPKKIQNFETQNILILKVTLRFKMSFRLMPS